MSLYSQAFPIAHRAQAVLLLLAGLGVRMTDDLETLGLGAGEVRNDPAGRNVVIGVVGLVLVIGALVPLTIGALYVGSLVFAGITSLLNGAPLGGL